MQTLSSGRISLATLGLIGILTTASVADPFKPSFKQQLDLGRRAAADIRKEEKLAAPNDPRLLLMREVAAKIVAGIPADELKKKPYEFSFDLIESPQINAFALPGGPIFFYTGLVDRMQTVDELAGVIAHEITHVREEHWANAYASRQKEGLGLTILLTILRANRTVVDLTSVGYEVARSLPYSRRDETRADRGGFDLMVRAGYHPSGLVKTFEMFAQASKGAPPEFLKTHPDDKNRIRNIRKWIEEAEKKGQKWPAVRPMPEAVQKARTLKNKE